MALAEGLVAELTQVGGNVHDLDARGKRRPVVRCNQELFDTPELKKWPIEQRIGNMGHQSSEVRNASDVSLTGYAGSGAFGDAFLVADPKTRAK